MPEGSSPHTRGARRRCRATRPGFRIIPAYAGSTRRLRRIGCDISGSSPHTRGALKTTIRAFLNARIIPAYAGSTSTVPMALIATAGSSPHTRGAPAPVRWVRIERWIIPAYAGSTETVATITPPPRDHPRIRGEHGGDWGVETYPIGSSPHTRGARADESRHRRRERIIPAYAGSTVEPSEMLTAQKDHPRIRGEHTCRSSPLETPGGSSPHTRGAPACATSAPRPSRIIPAYAGSTYRRHETAAADEDHPRIRGEHSTSWDSMARTTGSSPHTRGAPFSVGDAGDQSGIIPAYAGSTARGRRCPSARTDHPRIRGEHQPPTRRRLAIRGSSPHTRGARVVAAVRDHDIRIIPAYAGSTSAAFWA